MRRFRNNFPFFGFSTHSIIVPIYLLYKHKVFGKHSIVDLFPCNMKCLIAIIHSSISYHILIHHYIIIWTTRTNKPDYKIKKSPILSHRFYFEGLLKYVQRRECSVFCLFYTCWPQIFCQWPNQFTINFYIGIWSCFPNTLYINVYVVRLYMYNVTTHLGKTNMESCIFRICFVWI